MIADATPRYGHVTEATSYEDGMPVAVKRIYEESVQVDDPLALLSVIGDALKNIGATADLKMTFTVIADRKTGQPARLVYSHLLERRSLT